MSAWAACTEWKKGCFWMQKALQTLQAERCMKKLEYSKLRKYWQKICPNALLSATGKNYWKLSKNI